MNCFSLNLLENLSCMIINYWEILSEILLFSRKLKHISDTLKRIFAWILNLQVKHLFPWISATTWSTVTTSWWTLQTKTVQPPSPTTTRPRFRAAGKNLDTMSSKTSSVNASFNLIHSRTTWPWIRSTGSSLGSEQSSFYRSVSSVLSLPCVWPGSSRKSVSLESLKKNSIHPCLKGHFFHQFHI